MPPTTIDRTFAISGGVVPLIKARKPGVWVPTRPMGGWAAVYGQIGDDGQVVPSVDRDEQVFEAAGELGRIDWEPYIKGRGWNDTHTDLYVGVGTSLEFHDGSTEMSKSHRKVGFWTAGHLFDRNDPKSWEDWLPQERWPSPQELDRADFYWQLGQLLKGTPRPLGFSAEGGMMLSPCHKRILKARVDRVSICQVPVGPDATVEPMEVMGKAVVSLDAVCGRCACPEGGCQVRLAKAQEAMDTTEPVGEPSDADDDLDFDPETPSVRALVRRVMEYKGVTELRAVAFVRAWWESKKNPNKEAA